MNTNDEPVDKPISNVVPTDELNSARITLLEKEIVRLSSVINTLAKRYLEGVDHHNDLVSEVTKLDKFVHEMLKDHGEILESHAKLHEKIAVIMFDKFGTVKAITSKKGMH